MASCTASNQQTQGSVVATGVPWLPTCTPRVPPAPVSPPPCPATTALGARTWALGPTNPPGTTCTMPAVQAEGRQGGSPAWKPLAERRHPECISTPAIWELLSLAQNLAEGVREERFWFGMTGATHADKHWERKGWWRGGRAQLRHVKRGKYSNHLYPP